MTHSSPQPVTIFNTMTRSLEELSPITPGKIGLYCCGPTVYDYQHIGNFKTFICEDILVRMLRFAGYDVKFVMNITDVGHLVSDADEGEDKMAVAARREGKSCADIAQYYTDKFFEDWDALNLVRPDVTCKATDHIPEMIELIQKIMDNGYGYESNGNIYFDVEKFDGYGKLGKLDLKKLQAGARVDVDLNKKSPFDFALWFTSSKFDEQEQQWDSPFGRGYPGWHIECSAMSMKHLGEQFDIHCGGIDHIPVHHTNEIAQSEAATGKTYVNVWMHSEFIMLGGEKMSKSKGGFLVIDDLAENGYEPLAYRWFVLSANYRAQLNFSNKALENAQRCLNKARAQLVDARLAAGEPTEAEVMAAPLNETAATLLAEFSAAIRMDLNTAKGLAVLWRVFSEESIAPIERLKVLYTMDEVFGLKLAEYQPEEVTAPDEAIEMLAARNAARAAKDWGQADALRDQLRDLGWEIKDSKDGSELKPV